MRAQNIRAKALIGIDTPEGGRFVYCHTDGAPAWICNTLRAIIERDGPRKTVETLLNRGAQGGWSFLHEYIGDQKTPSSRTEAIPGYGVAHRDEHDPKHLTLSEALGSRSYGRYVYSIRPDRSIDIYERSDGRVWHWRSDQATPLKSDERPEDATLVTLTTTEEAGA